jgi:5-methylthioadenosine/S-adenosylhomocysteine deaminase
MREPADLLIEPRWLLPMAPDVVLEGHALAIGAGRILALGPAPELRARFEAREHLRREHHALLPGLVNAHARASLTLLRAALPYGGSAGHAAAMAAAAGADFVRDGTRLAIAQMLSAGITCFADLSPHPEEAARVCAAAQMRAAIGLPIGEAGSADGATAQLARAERLWDEYRADPRISLFFAPLGMAGLSDALLSRVRRVADELDARLALRVEAEQAADREWLVRDVSPSAATLLPRLAALGLLRPGFAAIQSAALPEADVALLARHGAALISCPQASLASGGARVPLLEGGRSALGTDSPLSAGAFDLLAEARTAALLSGFGAAEALRLATLGGATVLGLQAQIGSLEAGKVADLLCLELDALSVAGYASPEDAIVFGATRSQVSDVWSGGRASVSAHRLLAFDAEELAALPGAWASRLKLGAAA